MSETKHTPRLKVRDERRSAHTSDLIIVDLDGVTGAERQVAFVSERGNKERQRADAQLFAAAPELLAALKRILDYCDCVPVGPDRKPKHDATQLYEQYHQGRAAIAKAEGQEVTG